MTLEHAHRSNSPTGEIKSAPRDFEVYVSVGVPRFGVRLSRGSSWDLGSDLALIYLQGIQNQLGKETFLGNFTYNQFGEPSQTFILKDPGEEVFEAVELHVLTNWGQKEYTCLYRFRVHGHIAPVS